MGVEQRGRLDVTVIGARDGRGVDAVPVIDGDTPDSLSARVLSAEHRLYPHALALFAAGKVQICNERIEGSQATVNQAKALIWPPLP